MTTLISTRQDNARCGPGPDGKARSSQDLLCISRAEALFVSDLSARPRLNQSDPRRRDPNGGPEVRRQSRMRRRDGVRIRRASRDRHCPDALGTRDGRGHLSATANAPKNRGIGSSADVVAGRTMPAMGHMRAMRRRSVFAGLAVVVGFGAAAVAGPASAQEGVIRGAGAATAIPGSYIVVYKDGVNTAASSMAARYGGTIEHTYSAAIHGYAAAMSERQARTSPPTRRSSTSQQNKVMHALDTQADPLVLGYRPHRPAPPAAGPVLPVQHRRRQRERVHHRHRHPGHPPGLRQAGSSRVSTRSTTTTTRADCMGHGTHVAGTVGGTTYGVAKKVTLWAVRVLNCRGSGTTAQVVAGVDWVTRTRSSRRWPT